MHQTNLLFAISVFFAGVFISQTASANQTSLSLNDAKHLLFRTGFGASAGELSKLIGKSREEAVGVVISGLRHPPELPMPSWTRQPAPHHWARDKLSRTDKRKFNESRDREIASLRVWWVRQIIETGTPQSERLALMWHNHFATGYSGINSQSIAMARQHQLFREHSTGYFGTLLKRMIRDPALLNYLDNDKSRKRSPNENLARELLELFTIGEGNYTESDVKNAARALTGYSVEPLHNLQFRFKPFAHDNSDKTLFDRTGKFNGDDLVDLILQQEHTATFIAQRFWRTYISDLPPKPSELQQLAVVFRESGYNLLTLYRATLLSDAFWHPTNRASIVKSPISLVLGTIRSTGIVPQHWQTLPTVLANMGQNMFDPPNVAGWPGGAHWVTPSRLLYRTDWLEHLAKSCSGADCIAESATNTMAVSGNMMMQSDTSTMSSISVRLAAEDFDDPVQYQVSIYRAEEKLWTTGPVIVAGGHNSMRLGRMKLDQNIPWQIVEFSIDADTSGFDKIEVEFLNDAAKNGNDRNLFIDQVVVNGEHFPAATGKQNSSCPPKQPHHAGRLYCNGTLNLLRSKMTDRPDMNNRANAMDQTNTKSHSRVIDLERQRALKQTIDGDKDSFAGNSIENQFTAGGVYLQTAQPPNESNRFIGIALADVTLNGRHWHTINARFFITDQEKQAKKQTTRDRKSIEPSYALRLNNFSCWPDCVQQWPLCASSPKNDPDLHALTFPAVGNTGRSRCHYQSLTADDQALINALWHNIDKLFQLARENIPSHRSQLLAKTDRWLPHIDRMSSQYNASRYQRTDTPRLQLVVNNDSIPAIDDKIVRGIPLPAGQTAAQRELDWEQLTNHVPHVSLQTFLLPAPPLSEIHGTTLQTVLTDLSVQLQ